MEVLLLFILDFARIEQNNGRVKPLCSMKLTVNKAAPNEGISQSIRRIQDGKKQEKTARRAGSA